MYDAEIRDLFVDRIDRRVASRRCEVNDICHSSVANLLIAQRATTSSAAGQRLDMGPGRVAESTMHTIDLSKLDGSCYIPEERLLDTR